MKLLLDENLPHRLRPLLVGHEAFTVAYMNWQGIENGRFWSWRRAPGSTLSSPKIPALNTSRTWHDSRVRSSSSKRRPIPSVTSGRWFHRS
jgi:hypothetical protein